MQTQIEIETFLTVLESIKDTSKQLAAEAIREMESEGITLDVMLAETRTIAPFTHAVLVLRMIERSIPPKYLSGRYHAWINLTQSEEYFNEHTS